MNWIKLTAGYSYLNLNCYKYKSNISLPFSTPTERWREIDTSLFEFQVNKFFFVICLSLLWLRFFLAFQLEKGTIAAGHAQFGIVIRIMIDLIWFVFLFFFLFLFCFCFNDNISLFVVVWDAHANTLHDFCNGI